MFICKKKAFCKVYESYSHSVCKTTQCVKSKYNGGNKTNIPPLHVHAEHAIANISISLKLF